VQWSVASVSPVVGCQWSVGVLECWSVGVLECWRGVSIVLVLVLDPALCTRRSVGVLEN
jgi:hypothetical protein